MASDTSNPGPSRSRKKRRSPPPTRRQAARKGLGGPSTDPATNLLLADVALRGATVMARMAVEHALLRNRYDANTATTIIAKRGLGKKLLSVGMSRVAAKSLPGALLVSGGMLGKILYDRAKAQRQARKLAEKAEKIAKRQAPPDGKGNH